MYTSTTLSLVQAHGISQKCVEESDDTCTKLREGGSPGVPLVPHLQYEYYRGANSLYTVGHEPDETAIARYDWVARIKSSDGNGEKRRGSAEFK